MLIDHARAMTRFATAMMIGGVLAFGAVMPASAAQPAVSDNYQPVCSVDPANPSYALCDAMIRTDIPAVTAPVLAGRTDNVPAGYSPGSLQSAYNLTASSAAYGSGQTVAVVDAYNDSTAEADLAAYRSQFGLPACTVANNCLSITSQTGSTTALPPGPPSYNDWTREESIDVDMVSAICPNCKIDLVEANSGNPTDLGTAVNEAVSLGAKYISNSYGGGESPADATYDASYFNHPGVVITADTGDHNYGVEYPAASPYVIAVSGTTLTSVGGNSWTESAWVRDGSGCSVMETKPAWQTDTGCSKRTEADVSADADPGTGVAIYDTAGTNGGWLVEGGTSVASPIIASIYALAGPPAPGTYPAQYLYQHPSYFNDVTTGSNGTCSVTYLCTSGPGYDGPTGLGTPNGIGAFVPGAEIAFQTNTGVLWTATAGGGTNMNQGMMPGTSPSIAKMANGGYEVAFQANTGNLVVVGSAANTNTYLGMKAGTSPSIAASPNGGFQVSFQANTGYLWYYSSTTGLGTNQAYGMMAGTSPASTALSTGGYETAFQANTGALWDVGMQYNWSTGLPMKAGTSPDIAASPTGGYEVAVQANTGYLWIQNSTTGGANQNYGMMAGTSPAITALSTGGFEMAFQANTGALWDVGVQYNWTTSLTMKAGTSPDISATSNGSFQVAFQASSGNLWEQTPTAGGTNLGFAMMPGTSPSIAD